MEEKLMQLQQLAEQGYFTDVNIYNDLVSKPELLESFNISAFVSQVVAPVDAQEVEDFFEAMIKSGRVDLMQSVILSNTVIVEKELVINLNGYGIKAGLFTESNGEIVEGSTDSYCFWVKKGGKLIINGEGTLESQAAKYSIAVWVDGGEVEINGGVYKNNGEGADLIYASAGGKIIINDGEFIACPKQAGVAGTADTYTALNIKDADRKTTTIEVFGGKFHNFDPMNNASEGEGTNFVAEGYESVEVEAGVFEVRKKEENPVEVSNEPTEIVEPMEPTEIVVEEKEETETKKKK